jgi:multidrug efflux pump
VVPLVFAGGAGAAGRHDMGLVIFTGLSIGTLFTLFVVPAVYLVIGQTHKAEHGEFDDGDDLETLPPPEPQAH